MNSWIKKGFCLVVLVSILLTCVGLLAEEQIITKEIVARIQRIKAYQKLFDQSGLPYDRRINRSPDV